MGKIVDPLTLLETEEQEVRQLLLMAAQDLGSPLADLVGARISQLFPPIRAAIVLSVGFQSPDSPRRRRQRLSLAAGLEMLYVALNIHQLLLAAPASNSSREELDQTDRSFIGSTILAGDFCFSRSANLVAQTENPTIVAIFANALQTISDGQLRHQFGGSDGELVAQDALVKFGALAATELTDLSSAEKTRAVDAALQLVRNPQAPLLVETLEIHRFPQPYQERWRALLVWMNRVGNTQPSSPIAPQPTTP